MRKILMAITALGLLAMTFIPVASHKPLMTVAGWQEGVTRA